MVSESVTQLANLRKTRKPNLRMPSKKLNKRHPEVSWEGHIYNHVCEGRLVGLRKMRKPNLRMPSKKLNKRHPEVSWEGHIYNHVCEGRLVGGPLLLILTKYVDYQTGTASGKTGNLMDWNINNAFKTLKDMEPKSMMDMALIPSIDPIDIGLGSSEKANAAPQLKPRKKSMTSVYLKFFETAPDGKSRRCKFCKQSYSIATATGNLGRHLNHRHPGYDKLGDTITTQPPQSQPSPVTKKPPSQSQPQPQPQPQPQAKPPSVDFDHLNWLLLKWLIQGCLHPSIVEEEWLVNSFKFLNPSVKFWPSENFRAVSLEVFRSMQEDVRASLEHVNSKVSITLDFWNSFEQVSYMSVIGHWIDENWSLHKVLLDIIRIPYPCGGTDIYHLLVKILKVYNIDNRILSCTHDNSQNAVHGCRTLQEDLDGQKIGPFCYIPCAARMLNLIIEDGLRTAKPVVSKIREFVLEMNASLEISEDFRRTTAEYQEGSWKFPLDASNRWSGNYLLLGIVRKASKSMDAVIRKHEETLGSKNMLLNHAEKNAVNIMHAYLEPFYKTTNNICTSKVRTVGLVLFFMDHVAEIIASCRDSRHNPDWLKSAADDMAKKVRSYNTQVYNIFTYMAAVLDPRIKNELIPENLNSDNNLEEARNHFMRNYATNHFTAMANGYSAQESEDGSGVSFAEEIARKRRRVSISAATDELTQYLSEPPAPIPTDVLDWWKVNNTRYPHLSGMARDFLAVQATSVAPDELFCRKGDEIDKQRYCLPHGSMQALLCIRSWIQSGFKLKYRSTEVDYETLMEPVTSAVVCSADNSSTRLDKKVR
ncbi:zinc finger BED domain-containing protein DAYSLEEPER-like [Telopea speciosissima]|uniref:zinc finger BED domain-containing protein DAYSLEEPER-like n=1 Tax=Telopea speciosissima TaxID=54955 RepID=UPI001CC7B81B|nr:zinc finger BED domain-containing protein DAYSLEEPER-like [Telopea speciosissima]